MFQKGVETLLHGGWVMVPLLLCAVVSVAVMIERSVVLSHARFDSDTLNDDVRDLLVQEKPEDAIALCGRTPGAAAKVIAAGIRNRHRSPEVLERVLQEAALRELAPLNERLGMLDTIITLSPLLGLLGTITGMIQSFHVVASATGAGAAPAITGGVAEALIATATGLAIAIVTLPVYNHLTESVRDIATTLERRATEFQNVVSDLEESVTAKGGKIAHATAATPS